MPLSSSETQNIRRKQEAARWSLAASGTLLGLKIVVGAVTGSAGILAEAVNSAADLIGSALALLSVRASDEPPDVSHAYGHGKIENLSGAATAALILVGGVFAIGEAVRHLLHAEPLPGLGWGMGVMGTSAVVNWVVSRRLLRVGREADSPALAADGHHLQTDVVTSLGVLLGLTLVHLTGKLWWDSVAALGVSFLILRVGFRLAEEAVLTLSDAALPLEEEHALTAILTAHPDIRGFHKLRTRKSGAHRHVDVHVQIADTHTFVEAHRLTEDIEDQMRMALPNLHPIIHIEPYEEEVLHQRQQHEH
ncbi:MAG: cation diffusion facilitator family transporter [Janthinobacterium lividum]